MECLGVFTKDGWRPSLGLTSCFANFKQTVPLFQIFPTILVSCAETSPGSSFGLDLDLSPSTN